MPDGRYKIERPVASGGQALVSLARDTLLERTVAIKSLTPLWQGAPDEKDRERLRREARTLANLSHPCIPAVFDIELEEEPRIVFEFIRGKTLRELLGDRRPQVVEVVPWLLEVSSALSHAHAQGVLHRDVKPPNVIVREDGSGCCLVDFGLALHATDGQRLSSSSVAVGTPGYMSPEQARGEELDERADVYSLGVVLYEMLANKVPRTENYEKLSDIDETVPPALDDLVRDCLKPKEMRVSSAKTFADRLRAALVVKTSAADVISDGRLHEIEALLRSLTPANYASLSVGQRGLLLERFRVVIETGGGALVRAGIAFTAQLVRLAVAADAAEYSAIVDAALLWGFDKEFDQKWHGDPIVREALAEAAREVGRDHHRVFVARFLDWANRDFSNQEKWFLEGARAICQRLMVNANCGTEDAANLRKGLRAINDALA